VAAELIHDRSAATAEADKHSEQQIAKSNGNGEIRT
jgi:hypothetical protein